MLITTMTYPTKHQRGSSALSLAAERGDVDVMKVLIKRGADVNTQDKVIMYRSVHYIYIVTMWIYSTIQALSSLYMHTYMCVATFAI